jgi:proteasome lid subunit RPN8/RPN11
MRFELHAVAEKDLREHARRAFPQEACGLLAGGGAGAERYLPMSNVAGSTTRFQMDPVEFARRERELREAGLSIRGFFHSHPRGPARPSPADIADMAAGWPRQVHLILALDRGELTAWYGDPSGELQRIPIVGIVAT